MLGSRRRSSRLSSASQASSSNTKQDSPPLSPSSVERSPENKKKTTKRFQLPSVKKSNTKKKTPSQPSLDDPTDVPPAPTNASTSQDKGKGKARQIIQHLPAAVSIPPPQVSALPSFFPSSTGPESDGDDNNKRLLASFLQSSQPNQPFHFNPPSAYYPNDPSLPFGEVMHVENAAEIAPFEQAGGYDNGVPPSMGGAGAGGIMIGVGGGAGPAHQQAHPLLNLYADIARIFYLTNPNEAQILINTIISSLETNQNFFNKTLPPEAQSPEGRKLLNDLAENLVQGHSEVNKVYTGIRTGGRMAWPNCGIWLMTKAFDVWIGNF